MLSIVGLSTQEDLTRHNDARTLRIAMHEWRRRPKYGREQHESDGRWWVMLFVDAGVEDAG
jgi:hypothetical protein